MKGTRGCTQAHGLGLVTRPFSSKDNCFLVTKFFLAAASSREVRDITLLVKMTTPFSSLNFKNGVPVEVEPPPASGQR